MRIPFFRKNQSQYIYLKEKWSNKHQKLQQRLWENHHDALQLFLSNPKRLLMGTLAGIIMLSTPPAHASSAVAMHQTVGGTFRDVDKKTFLLNDLYPLLPQNVEPLTSDQENKIAAVLSNAYGIKVTPELHGIRLNRSYGLIGQEQLLPRYPGDTIDSPFDTSDDVKDFYSYGMTPGRGAWGYFAPSKEEMTQEDALRARWYIAVPTFLAPGFQTNVKEYGDFFKHRQMLVVNPNNGKAVVADIADSGPSEWTGKNLGGSPRVMHYLDRVDGEKKGPVLYFFIEDSQGNVPLGPVEL